MADKFSHEYSEAYHLDLGAHYDSLSDAAFARGEYRRGVVFGNKAISHYTAAERLSQEEQGQ